MNHPPLTLFYDGLCPLCSREAAHFRRCAAGDSTVAFVDITDPSFDPAAHGLDAARIHREMHVKEGESVHVGIDAFLAIWRRVPGHSWLTRLASLPGAYWLLKAGYLTFASIRPLLPRRKASCDSRTCRR